MARVASKIDALFSIYKLLIGKHPQACQILEDYEEAKQKLETRDDGEQEREIQDIGKKILAKLNKIVIEMKSNGLMESTGSTAVQGFLIKHGNILKMINVIHSIVFNNIPMHSIKTSDTDNVDLESIFKNIDERKVEINVALRDVIANMMIDGHVPEWMHVTINNNYLVDEENKAMLAMVMKRLKLDQ